MTMIRIGTRPPTKPPAIIGNIVQSRIYNTTPAIMEIGGSIKDKNHDLAFI